jgi:hypothetical protein
VEVSFLITKNKEISMKIFLLNHKLDVEGYGCVLTKKVGESYGEPEWFPSLAQASSKLLEKTNYDTSTDLQKNNTVKALKAIVAREERNRLTSEIRRLLKVERW